MRGLTSTLGLAAALIGCATTPTPPADTAPPILASPSSQADRRAHEIQGAALGCEAKHGAALPQGATPARPDPPLRVGAQPGGPRAAYACIMVTVNERGEATDARVLETDSPPFADYLISLALRARYQPAMRDGKPFTQQSVVSAAYW